MTTIDIQHSGDEHTSLRDKKYFYPTLTYSFIIIISALLRFIRLGFNDENTPVFDEKHYSVQAMQMVFNHGIENNPGYGLVVHPPFGKFLISIGEYFFGYTPLGWRFISVMSGLAIILLLCVLVHKITNSLVLVVFTGFIANTEGVLFGMSRMGMLDIFQALFITVIAFCLYFYMRSDYTHIPWSQRWWLYGVGIFSGLAMAVKISGVFYPAVIGVVLVIYTAFSTKSVRETTKSFFHGLFCLLVIPITVFFMTWIPWFRNETSWSFHAIDQGGEYYRLPEFLQPFVPERLENWISYQVDVMDFHTGLTTSEGNLHPWESKPWEWLYGNRPMLFLNDYPNDYSTDSLSVVIAIVGIAIFIALASGVIYTTLLDSKFSRIIQWIVGVVSVVLSFIYGTALLSVIHHTNDLGNSQDTVISKVWLLGNISVWGLTVPLILYGIYKIVKKDAVWIIAVGGYLTGFVPWLINYDRQMYFFYTVTLAPFVILMVVLAIRDLSDFIAKKRNIYNHEAYLLIGGIYCFIIVLVFILYIPWYYGLPLHEAQHDFLTIMDSWHPLEKDN